MKDCSAMPMEQPLGLTCAMKRSIVNCNDTTGGQECGVTSPTGVEDVWYMYVLLIALGKQYVSHSSHTSCRSL